VRVAAVLSAALLAAPTLAAGCDPEIATPPSEELERAWQAIGDPQLAAQLRPEAPFAAADCVVHLSVWREHANARQRTAIDRATKAWRVELVREFDGDEDAADQMIGSSVNPLADTPAPMRQAAAAWCIAHAPAGQP
jgi:hypothetical protein